MLSTIQDDFYKNMTSLPVYYDVVILLYLISLTIILFAFEISETQRPSFLRYSWGKGFYFFVLALFF